MGMKDEELARILAEYDEKSPLYSEFLKVVELIVKEVCQSKAVTSLVSGRVKARVSLEAKIRFKGAKYTRLVDITDIAGVRVIVPYREDSGRIAKALMAEFKVDPVNSRDKSNDLGVEQFGYQSIHLIVSLTEARATLPEYSRFEGMKAEIQVRSIVQHAWAQIEHGLGYKSQGGVPVEVRRRMSRLAAVLELADQEFSSIRDLKQESQSRDLDVVRMEGVTELLREFTIQLPINDIARAQGLGCRDLAIVTNVWITNRLPADPTLRFSILLQGREHKGELKGNNTLLLREAIGVLAMDAKSHHVEVQVRNLRVCAAMLSDENSTVQCAAYATADPSLPSDPVMLAVTDLAYCRRSLDFVALGGTQPQIAAAHWKRSTDPVGLEEGAPAEYAAEFQVALKERFQHAIRNREEESPADFIAPADHGTRLLFRVSGAPAGVEVTCQLEGEVTATPVGWVRTDVNGAGLVSPEPQGSSWRRIELIGGYGFATFEWIEDQTRSARAVFLKFRFTFRGEQAPKGSVFISGALAPSSLTLLASSSAPIPRFASNRDDIVELQFQ
ncbi:MAG: hypothetical protein J0L64_22030 [Acidobacteria bacterium]|nr:hypothetical protein [Acidobacteriota bacterium]